jgi:hypothetical protein
MIDVDILELLRKHDIVMEIQPNGWVYPLHDKPYRDSYTFRIRLKKEFTKNDKGWYNSRPFYRDDYIRDKKWDLKTYIKEFMKEYKKEDK